MTLKFEILLTPPEPDERDAPRRPTRTPQCVRCGRFCRILSDEVRYSGWINQNYVTFDCARCGTYTESMW